MPKPTYVGGAQTTRCRDCGASVWFLKHEQTGKLAPIEVLRHPEGNVCVDLARLTYRVISSTTPPQGPRYRSHFASCPAAAARRRHPRP